MNFEGSYLLRCNKRFQTVTTFNAFEFHQVKKVNYQTVLPRLHIVIIFQTDYMTQTM